MSPEVLECHVALFAAAARLRAAHRALEAAAADEEERRRVCAELRAAEDEYLCLRVLLIDR